MTQIIILFPRSKTDLVIESIKKGNILDLDGVEKFELSYMDKAVERHKQLESLYKQPYRVVAVEFEIKIRTAEYTPYYASEGAPAMLGPGFPLF